jgi:hypothetical protein
MTRPRQYEIQKFRRHERGQRTITFADTPELALAKAEERVEDGYVIRIREYELSGMPGIPPARPDRFLTVTELREELSR